MQIQSTTDISNPFLQVQVEQSSGRFGIHTTGGDPATVNDDNQSLLSTGTDYPLSLTSLRTGNGTYRLGVTNSGSSDEIAPSTAPFIDGSAVKAVWNKDGIQVEQRLLFDTGSSTGRADMVAIEYNVTNTNATSQNVGLRLLLDVEVGYSGGGEFTVPGQGPLIYETEWAGSQVPPSWFATDNGVPLRSETVARGDLIRSGATPPDRFAVVSRASANSKAWDYNIPAYAWIPADAAVLLYYNQVAFTAGQTRTFRTYVGIGDHPILPPDQNRQPEDCVCQDPQPQYNTPYPVNTRTGNFWTEVTDLTVQTPGPALVWNRAYNSQSVDEITGPLGYGWQHTFGARLITPTMPGGEAGRIIILSPKGNRLRYLDLGQNQYQAFPGVYSTLTRAGNVYTQTLRDQTRLMFDATTGELTAMQDAQGRQLTLGYSTTTPRRLLTITDATNSTRALTLTYHADGRIATVSDGTRTVTYTYKTTGDLETVADVMGRTTTYGYGELGDHRLRKITNALGEVVEQITYTGDRVTAQILHDGRQIQFQYPTDPNAAGVTTMTTTASGHQEVQEIAYDGDGTMLSREVNDTTVLTSNFDNNFAPNTVIDGNGNTSRAEYGSLGQPLRMTDAMGNTTEIEYNAQGYPTTIIDAMGHETTLTYDAANNLVRRTTGITPEFPLGFTTVYTYNVHYPGKNWLEEQLSHEGIVTRYDYDATGQTAPPGQPTRIIVNYENGVYEQARPDEDIITSYGYDALGRRTRTTVGVGTALERRDDTIYNADNSVAQTIQNYKNGLYDAQHPDEDLITAYGYDRLGRQVWVRNVLEQYDITHYNTEGQIDWTVRNMQPESVQFDQYGYLNIAATPPTFNPATPDTNVVTTYHYDGLGRRTHLTETGLLGGTFNPATRTFSAAVERTTFTEYDALSQPTTVTINYDPATYQAVMPIEALRTTNLQVFMRYDAAGNLIGERDAIGRWTCYDHDSLNRVIKTIRNCENGDPLTVDEANESWTDGTDTDIISVARYRPDGQVAWQIDNYGQKEFTAEEPADTDGLFTITEPITDRITLYTYDSLGRVKTTTQNYDPPTLSTRKDTNRKQTTAYDATTGRVIGTQDPLGRWTHTSYDDLGRVLTTIQNCRTTSGVAVAEGCAAFNSTATERNIPTTITYDALGRIAHTTNALGQVTHQTYDGVGRVLKTTRNYTETPATPPHADENVTTQSAYDGLGHTTIITDEVGAETHSQFDGLGNTVVITDSVGRVSRMGYDGLGNQRWSLRADGQLTLLEVDALGRVVKQIEHYQDGSVSPSEPVDQDLITQTIYDSAGRRIQTIDAAGRVKALGYDLQNRLIWVQENLRSDCAAPNLPTSAKPCNVTTRYTYDRVGNQTAITDARGNKRSFNYDAASQQIAETGPLGPTTTVTREYDEGGRLLAERDPRGSAYDRNYTYDALDRLTGKTATNLSGPITQSYDALGRRTQLNDATGTTSFSMDALGRITGVNAPQTGSVGYNYNARGERTQLRYPNGPTIDYRYWPDGQLQEVLQGNVPLVSYQYEPQTGRLQQVSRANGATTTYGYDGVDRLRSLNTSVNGTTQSAYQYDLDRLGLRTQVTETIKQPVSAPSTASAAPAEPMAQTVSAVMAPKSEEASLNGTTTAGAIGRQASSGQAQQNTAQRKPQATLSTLPLAFVPNAGQSDQTVRFQVHGHQGESIFFTPSQMVLSLPIAPSSDPAAETAAQPNDRAQQNARSQAISIRFEGAKGASSISGVQKLPGVVNYLTSDDRSAWRTNLTTYAGIVYDELYPGIDLHYEGQSAALKGTYTVAPGADPAAIRWRYDRAAQMTVDQAGDLQIAIPSPEQGRGQPDRGEDVTLTESAPVAWQEVAGKRSPVTVSYTIHANGSVGFRVGTYDRTRPLIIDPTLNYSTYVGGSGDDEGQAIAVDSAGNAYITGATGSVNFPTKTAFQSSRSNNRDVFVTKLNATGTALVYSTYLGGGGNDFGASIAIDGSGSAFITGHTTSNNFPVANALQATPGGTTTPAYDAFVTKLSSTGNALTYSTYLGGSSSDYGYDIAVDGSGQAVIVGATWSNNFPKANALQTTYGGLQDGFITKLSATGNALVASTYLGGADQDSATSLALDASGNIYVTGETRSSNFPLATPLQPAIGGGNCGTTCPDAFVTKLNASASTLLYSTYVGGNQGDGSHSIAVDSAGSAYLTGRTGSSNFPVANALQATLSAASDAFVTKINASGSALVYSTYLGGNTTGSTSGIDRGYGIAVDSAGNAYVTGMTESNTFPVVNALQTTRGGSSDAFAAKLNAAGSALVYSTYLGGNKADIGYGIALDTSGNVYLTGSTTSTNFPTAGAFQAQHNGGLDAFVTKLNPTGNTLVYSTYLGGSTEDIGVGIAVDTSGNVYLTGNTRSPNYGLYNNSSTYGGGYDAFVTKVNAAGAALYSTYLGGSADDNATDLAVDSSGNVYVSGSTLSSNFPVVNAYQSTWHGSRDAFAAKLNAAGNALLYSTYLGGNTPDFARDIAIDSAGNAYLAGETESTNFPLMNPFQATFGGNRDVFVTKLSASGNTLVYSTYLGGLNFDGATGIAVDAGGNAYLTGSTNSSAFPVANAFQATRAACTQNCIDAFVTKLNASGNALTYSTYLGGNGNEEGSAIAIDSAGHAYVTGYTYSTNFPMQNPAQANHGGIYQQAFVTKLAPGGNALVYSTYLGGTNHDTGVDIAVDAAGKAYVTGATGSADFPLVAPIQQTQGGSLDAFVTRLSADGTQYTFSTFIGGSLQDRGEGIAVDAATNIYITGQTDSTNFPTAQPYQGTYNGKTDAFVLKINEDIPPQKPGNLRSTAKTASSVSLAWDAATDNGLIVDYDIYKDGTLAGSVAGTSTTLNNLTPLTSYTFTVKARDTGGNLSPPSDSLTVTTAPDTQAPAKPTNFRSTGETSTSVSLAWNAAIDNVGVTSYEVYVGPTLNQTTSGTNATVTGLAAGVTYTFTVIAIDAAGNRSVPSSAVAVRTTPVQLAETRTITYTYDGLLRLTGAVESPGIEYQYGYDEVGNRTQVQVNGLVVEQRAYNPANQVVGWNYDAAGNLLQDDTNVYGYDAFNRLTMAQGYWYEYTYNGDGVLVHQKTVTSNFRYTQDLAAPLSQILQQQQVNGSRTDYIYGAERLLALKGTTRTWYGSDALGSLRQTLSDTGTPQAALHYDPWGQVESITQPATFGFAGELYSSGANASYMRARWYQPGHGTFVSRDPFSGFAELPYSLHPYQYGYSDPISRTDASGQCPAPVGMTGGVLCVDLFIQAKTLGFGFAEGDGRTFDANSDPSRSRAYIYIPVDDNGRMRGEPQSHVNPSCTKVGCFEPGAAPYNQWRISQDSQTGWITVRWDNFLNAASVAAYEAAHKVAVEDGMASGACLVEVGTKVFAPPAIDGQVVLGQDKNGRYTWLNYDRDPYPSLEIYYYRDGKFQHTILQRPEHWLGANYGLNPVAFNDSGYNMQFDWSLPQPQPGPAPRDTPR